MSVIVEWLFDVGVAIADDDSGMLCSIAVTSSTPARLASDSVVVKTMT